MIVHYNHATHFPSLIGFNLDLSEHNHRCINAWGWKNVRYGTWWIEPRMLFLCCILSEYSTRFLFVRYVCTHLRRLAHSRLALFQIKAKREKYEKSDEQQQRQRRRRERRDVRRRDGIALMIFVIQYICAFEMTQNAWNIKKKRTEVKSDRRARDKQEEKRMKIFIIVRVIRHRGFRGNDDEDDAERPREIIRLAVTIIDHNESHRERNISQSNYSKIKKSKICGKKTDDETIA